MIRVLAVLSISMIFLFSAEEVYAQVFLFKIPDTVPLHRPRDVFVDNNDNIYISDQFGVVKVDPQGKVMWVGSAQSYSVAADNNGRVYAGTELGIYVFDKNGNFVTTFLSGSGNTKGASSSSVIAVDHNGYVYRTSFGSNAVTVLDSDGNILLSFGSYGMDDGEFNHPVDIAVDAKGRIYVLDGNDRVQVFDNDGKFLFKFGSPSKGDGEFRGPHSIAIDNKNRIYVTDAYFGPTRDREPHVQVFDGDGKFLFKFGIEDAGALRDIAPSGIDIDSNGRIYIVDTYNDRIRVFDSEGKFLYKIGSRGHEEGEFYDPAAIALDGDGRIYVADRFNSRIQVFDSTGKFLFKFGSYGRNDGQFAQPTAVAVDNNNGRIYVADGVEPNTRVQVFDSGGTFLFKISSSDIHGFRTPAAIAVNSHGRLYVADDITIEGGMADSRVQVFDSKGSFLFKFGVLGSGEGDVISPTQIAIDTDEKIYVITEVLFHRGIKVFDSDGNFLFKFGSLDLGDDEFGARSGIAVDSSGRIYVTDRTYHNVQIFDNDGNFLYKFGTLGNNDGQFSIPSGIAVDSTRIYVVDSENNRIQVFQIDEARIPEFPLNLMFIAAVGLMGILIAVRVKNHKLTP